MKSAKQIYHFKKTCRGVWISVNVCLWPWVQPTNQELTRFRRPSQMVRWAMVH